MWIPSLLVPVSEAKRFENMMKFKYLDTTERNKNYIYYKNMNRQNFGNVCYYLDQNLIVSYLQT